MADNFTPVQAQKFKLAGSGVTATATTIVLQSFKTPDGDDITLALLGTQGFATMEPGTSREEVVTITAVVQNGDGTASITVTRGVDFVAPYAADSSRGKAHSGGTIFVLSNPAVFYDQWAGKNNDETMTQTWTFSNPNFPRINTDVDPTDDEQMATKGYVDRTAGGAPVSKNREVIAGIAGATIAIGDAIYFNEADSEWYLTDSSNAATSEAKILGIAQGAGTDGVGITGGVLISGIDINQTGLVNGTYYLQDTAGTIGTTPGTISVEIGAMESATELLFAPAYKTHITEEQQQALAGTVGTPSDTNRYVTNDDTTGTGDIIRGAGGITGQITMWSGSSAPTNWFLCDGQAINIDTYADLYAVIGQNYGITGATAFTAEPVLDIITSNGHGLVDDDRVYLSNSGGALPTGLNNTTTYYIITATTNTFQLSLTQGGAAVDFSDAGTGTHNWHNQVLIPNLEGNVPVGLDSGQTEFDALGEVGGLKEVTLTANESGLRSHGHTINESVSGNTNSGYRSGAIDTNGLDSGVRSGYVATTAGPSAAIDAHENMPPYVVLNYIIKT